MHKLVWFLDEGKFLTKVEVKRLKEVVEQRKDEALKNGKKTAVRDWFAVNLGLFTGLRVQEMADLKHCDIIIFDSKRQALFVRRGKGGKARLVKFSLEFKEILLEYIEWKRNVGEPCGADDPLIYSSNSKGHMTTRGIQKVFERNAKRAGIEGHSIHHLRHTYGSFFYKASSHNIRMLQKQLGHSSVEVTEVYAHVFELDLERALKKLYG